MTAPSHRPLPEDAHRSQEADINAPAGFEPAISASDRPQTLALQRSATGTGSSNPFGNTSCDRRDLDADTAGRAVEVP